MEIVGQLLGRLHPLIVHLPIGCIVMAGLLWWGGRKRPSLRDAVPFLLFWGGLTALIACVSGYLLYQNEGYAYATVNLHLWAGILTFVCCFLGYFRFRPLPGKMGRIPIAGMLLFLFLLVSFTGHQGGNITHGPDYLTEPLPPSIKGMLGTSVTSGELVLDEQEWESVLLYEDAVRPILDHRCASCHNRRKAKGELTMHDLDALLVGGEHGEAVVVGRPDESLLYTRMTLPLRDEDHMPPEEKEQPLPEEISLIRTWIEKGAPTGKTLQELGLKENLIAPFFPKDATPDFPTTELAAVSPDSLVAAKSFGIHIDPISADIPWVRVSCINQPEFSDYDFDLLFPFKEYIAILDLGGTKVTDAIWERLARLPHLTRLTLDHTTVHGNGIEKLSGLAHLSSINLTHTQFDPKSLSGLASIPSLKKVYLYGTPADSLAGAQGSDTDIEWDTGQYALPPLASDTLVY